MGINTWCDHVRERMIFIALVQNTWQKTVESEIVQIDNVCSLGTWLLKLIIDMH